MQHIHHLKTQPEDYRPARCPHCGIGGLWHHGCYTRKANRRCLARETDEPILIPRFRCQTCAKTCSCLPEVIPPRRHYLWGIQALALLLTVTGISLNQMAHWLQRLQSQFAVHSFHLRSCFPILGRSVGIRHFWLNCISQMPFSEAMFELHRCGVIVP